MLRKTIQIGARKRFRHSLLEQFQVPRIGGCRPIAEVRSNQLDGEWEAIEPCDDCSGGVLFVTTNGAPIGFLDEHGVGVVRVQGTKWNRCKACYGAPPGQEQVRRCLVNRQVRLNVRTVFNIVKHDKPAAEGADAVERDIELGLVVRLRANPASLLGGFNELGLYLLVGRDPDDATWVLVAIRVGILDGELSLAQATKPRKGGGLPDARRAALFELTPDLGERVGAADDLIAFLPERDIEGWMLGAEVGDRCVPESSNYPVRFISTKASSYPRGCFI